MSTTTPPPSGSLHPLVGPRCDHCGEAPHQLKNCPAAQSAEVTRMHLLACRNLLRECNPMLDESIISARMSGIEDRINAELRWPNDKLTDRGANKQ